MQLLRLVSGQVRVGHPLPFGVRDEHGKLLLAQGQVVASDAQLEVLLQRGATVDIEEVRAAVQRHAAGKSQRPPTLFGQWEHLLWELDRALRNQAEAGFVERIDALRSSIVALTERDPDIAVYLSVRQDPKRLTIYPLAHSIHCAKVGLLMARRLAWDEPRTTAFLRAALTMNIATLELQGRLAAQGIKPTPDQLTEIRAHPNKGVELLRAAGVTDPVWLEIVQRHHERPDGSGYPAGVQETGELPNALRLLDVFLAKMAPRALRAPTPPQLAARQLFQEDGGGPVSSAIIKEFGIYPPGEFVQLKSGEQAVVVRRGASATTPLAAAVTDKAGVPSINTPIRNTAKPEFAIASLLRDQLLVLRVPPERLYGLPE
jgi:HD-GYP domain-containing protein (c-di-GMP phosphodiesterase class II)